jgi:hypothetical protein
MAFQLGYFTTPEKFRLEASRCSKKIGLPECVLSITLLPLFCFLNQNQFTLPTFIEWLQPHLSDLCQTLAAWEEVVFL